MSNCSAAFESEYLLLVLYSVGVNVAAVFTSDCQIKVNEMFGDEMFSLGKKILTVITRRGRCQSFVYVRPVVKARTQISIF